MEELQEQTMGRSIETPTTNQQERPVPADEPPSIALLGVCFDNVTLRQALERIGTMVASREPHYIVTPNVDFVIQARGDAELRRILLDAHLVVCDGTPLVWASRLLGNPLPERVAGSDLVPLLLRDATERHYRLFFLGGTPESNAQAIENVEAQFPGIHIVGHYSPPFRSLMEMDHEQIARRIREARPDVLLVSFGCPKAEKWIAMHYRSLGVPVSMGVGATIDFLAGRVKRAPRWMQRSGLEWLYRVIQEPRRLFRRYARDIWCFGWALTAQWWQTRAGRGRPEPVSQALRAVHCSRCQRLEAPARLDAATIRATAPLWQGLERRHCLLDLAEVRFIDSTGVAHLMRLHQRLRSAGQQLVLLAPSRAVERAFGFMRWTDFLAVAPDAMEAKRIIQARSEEPTATLHDPTQLLAWRGEITVANADAVWKLTEPRLVSLRSREQKVTIDLDGVRFIDSTAAGVMVRAKEAAERQGTNLQFVGATPGVRNVLRLAKVEDRLLEKSA